MDGHEPPSPDFHSVSPFNRWMGMRSLATSDESARVELQPRSEMVQEMGVIHGSVVTALADTAAVQIGLRHLEEDEAMASVEFKLNFLAPARTDGGPLSASSTLVKAGRRVVVCESTVRQDAEVIALGLFTYLRFVPSNR